MNASDLQTCLRNPPLEAWSAPKKGQIIWACTSFCGGNGDRIRGIISTFALALCLGTDFKMIWTHPINHNQLFAYPITTLKTAVSINLIDKNIPLNKDWSAVMQKNGILQIFTNARPHVTKEMKSKIFHMLLRPKPVITSLFSSVPNGCKVCLHIRTGDSEMNVGRAKKNNDLQLMQLAHAYNRQMINASMNVLSRICTFTDSMTMKKRLHDDKRFWFSSFEPIHTDRTRSLKLNDVALTWAEMFAMATCEVLVKSSSGFSDIAVSLANMSQIEDYVFAIQPNTNPLQLRSIFT